MSDIETYTRLVKPSHTPGEPCERKISPLPDKEGKVRLIAIPDYWTQSFMYPLHEYLNDILKQIPEDCTFNQDNFLRLLDSPDGTVYYSIDLKNATDYMPSKLQAAILATFTKSVKIGTL